MNWIILTSQFILLGLGILLWIWFKGLPAAIHKRQELMLSQQLSKELELLKINQSQISLRKIEKFIDFGKLQQDIFTNESFRKKIESNDPKAVAKLRELTVELGIGIFFFASDSTIKMYSQWKKETGIEGADPKKTLLGLGELMIALRKDVGYEETTLSSEDYLRMFITDWDSFAEKKCITKR